MSFLSYGSAKALSYTHDFQKDIDRLYQREAYGAQLKAEREKKSMFYASLMKEGTAATQYNTQRLESLYEGLQKEIADYAVANPDLEQDPRKLAHLMNISDKFLNNNIIVEDQEVQKHWNITKEAFAKGDIYEDEYFEAAERYTNYSQNGGDPYVFGNPKRKEFLDIWQESQVLMKPIVKVDEKGNQVITTSAVPEGNFALAANMALSDKDNYRTIEQMFRKIPEEQRAAAGWKSPNDYYASLLRQGNQPSELERRYSELYLANVKAGIAASQNAVPSYFVSGVLNKMNSNQEITGDIAIGALTEFGGKTGTVISTPETGRFFKVADPSGNGQLKDIHVNGNIVTRNAVRSFNIGGVGYIEYNVDIALEGGKPNENTVKSLLDNGFVTKQVTLPGMLSMSVDKEVEKSNTYTGSLILPMVLSDANIRNYDRMAGMTETAIMANEQSGAYNIDAVLSRAYNNNEYYTYNNIIRSRVNDDISVAKKQSRASQTDMNKMNVNERKAIEILSKTDPIKIEWERDPQIPGAFIGNDGINSFTYIPGRPVIVNTNGL